MISIYKKYYKSILEHLGIRGVVSVRFSNTKLRTHRTYHDTVSTILARSLKKGRACFIDRRRGQLCPGGNYFLGISHPRIKEICNVYVKDEHVFSSNAICSAFLRDLPKYPARGNTKYILFTPLRNETQIPGVVLLLVTPAQAGRILGLGAYTKMRDPSIFPAGPTVQSIIAPLVSRSIHINFIDYFDRYYQSARDGVFVWNDSELIISMSFDIFRAIVNRIPISAHGIYRPTIPIQNVEPLD